MKNAEKTFRSRIGYFLNTPTPTRCFYIATTAGDGFHSIPKEAIKTIQESFQARMRQNLG